MCKKHALNSNIGKNSLVMKVFAFNVPLTFTESLICMAAESAELISLVDMALFTMVAAVRVPLMLTASLICMAVESSELMLFNSTVPTFNVVLIMTLPVPLVSR